MRENIMNRFFATLWRWTLILLVYLALGVPVVGLVVPGSGGQAVEIPMLFQSSLRAAASAFGFFPDNMYYEDWQFWLSGYSMNCLAVSLALVVAWNMLYAPGALGRNRERSSRVTFWLFAIAHAAALLFLAFLYFTSDARMWAFLISQPASRGIIVLMPQLLIIPFWLSIRALCPYRIYHMFPIFAQIRAPLRLRVYSKRGAR
jgi:hypothetical protein